MTIREIKLKTEIYFNFKINGEIRETKYLKARQFYCAFARMNNFTLGDIGKEIKRGHATIINAINKFGNNIVYTSYAQDYLKYLAFMYKVEPEKEVVEVQVNNTDFPNRILEIAKELNKLPYSDVDLFEETRLKPFLNMLGSRKIQEVKQIKGASLNRIVENPFLK